MKDPSMIRGARQDAFTLLEAIVSLLVVGILVALLLMSIQSSRLASRRMQCQANLQQLGIGIQAYEAARRKLPGDDHSFHVQLLPYLELPALHELRDRDPEALRQTHIPLFCCPSDDAPDRIQVSAATFRAGTNYVGNAGTWYTKTGFDGLFRYAEIGPALALADIRDGLSATGIVCESLRADLSLERLRVNWNTSRHYAAAAELNEFARECNSLPKPSAAGGLLGNRAMKGTPWTISNVGITWYNHVLPPNAASCINGSDVISSAATVSSRHAQGVNLLFVDGHVAFESQMIDLTVWRALGTRRDFADSEG